MLLRWKSGHVNQCAYRQVQRQCFHDFADRMRRDQQLQWTDPQSGYLRRNISPPHLRSPIQIVEVEFPAGATVSYAAGVRETGIHQ